MSRMMRKKLTKLVAIDYKQTAQIMLQEALDHYERLSTSMEAGSRLVARDRCDAALGIARLSLQLADGGKR